MKISFIIPVYNVAPWLRACLDSIELHEEIEVVCVDDGSTDGSAEILDGYALRDSRIKVVHQANAGVSTARNAALKIARGDYISFVDPDDILRNGAVMKMLRRITEYPEADIISFGNIQFQDGDNPAWSENDETKEIDISSSIPDGTSGMCVCGELYKRTILPMHGFKPYCRGEDLLFVSECLCRANLVEACDYQIYGYRQRKGSAMNSRMTPKKLEDRIGYTRDWVNALIDSGKAVSRNLFKFRALNLTEGYISDLITLEECEQVQLWQIWYSQVLPFILSKDVFPLWTVVVARICLVLRLKFVAYIFCVLPHRLKVMGLHR